MKLSISNIAWSPQWDKEMYRFLQKSGYTGIEIAPTRLFPEAPYEHCSEAQTFAVWLKDTYGLSVSSMQSIWKKRKIVWYSRRQADAYRIYEKGNRVCITNGVRQSGVRLS